MLGKKFCMVCEEEIPRDSVFCPKCGAQTSKTEQRKTNLPIEEETKAYGEKTVTKKSNWKIIIAGAFGILVLVTVAALFLSSKSPLTQTYDNTLGATEYYNQGLSLYDQEKYSEAIPYFDKALEINPNYKEAWLYKGLSLDDLGRYSEAITYYDKAISIDPNYIIPWYNKGIILGNQGYYEDAMNCFDKVISIDPKDAEAWYYKGVCLEVLGRLSEAEECYDKAEALGFSG